MSRDLLISPLGKRLIKPHATAGFGRRFLWGLPRAGGLQLVWRALMVLALAACSSSGHGPDTLPQRWGDLDVRVETRPSPPSPGMNEFLVIITDARGQPGWDCLVALRTAETDPWKQAIQDGRVGVFRRAALVARGERAVIQVQISHGDQQTVLHFPINLAPGG